MLSSVYRILIHGESIVKYNLILLLGLELLLGMFKNPEIKIIKNSDWIILENL